MVKNPPLSRHGTGGTYDRWLYHIFLAVSSGAIVFIEDLDGSRGEYVILLTVLVLSGLLFLRNRDRDILYPLQKFWLVAGSVIALKLLHSLVTAFLGDALDSYQIIRDLYGLLYILGGVYIIRSLDLDPRWMIRIGYYYAALILLLMIFTLVSGHRLFAAAFAGNSVSTSLENNRDKSLRLVPFYFEFMVWLLFVSINDLTSRRGRLMPAQWFWAALLCVAMLLSSSRSVLGAAAFSAVAYLGIAAKKWKALASTVVVMSICLALAYVIPSPLQAMIGALVARTQNLMVQGDAWRFLELSEAYSTLQRTGGWLFGLPLGTPYTSLMSILSGDGPTGYARSANYDMHNVHMFFITYFGVPGYLILFGTLLSCCAKIIRHRPASENSGAEAASSATAMFLIYLLVEGLASSTLLKGFSALSFGVAVGFVIRLKAVQTAPRVAEPRSPEPIQTAKT